MSLNNVATMYRNRPVSFKNIIQLFSLHPQCASSPSSLCSPRSIEFFVDLTFSPFVMFSLDIRPTISFRLISLITIPFPLSYADYIRLLHLFLLSLITPIVDPPWYYLVADSLSPYQRLGFYPVQYINPQSGVTIVLELCPLG